MSFVSDAIICVTERYSMLLAKQLVTATHSIRLQHSLLQAYVLGL